MGRVIHHQVDENRQQGAQQGPAFASANEASRDTVRKIRQHEAAAATRAAPLAALERREIAPRDWLEAARAEAAAPLLVMPEGETLADQPSPRTRR